MSKTGIASARPVVRPFNLKKMKEFIKSTVKNGVSTFLGNALGSFGQGVANRIFGETLEDKQRYAIEQMEKQAQLNRENYDYQFDKQLQATDPSFIRQRLEQAALAPSLAFSGGASSPGISAQMSSSSPAGGISSSLRSGQMVNMAESLARIRNMDADTESKQTETDYNQKAMQTRLDILSQEKLSKIYANNISRIDALYKERLTVSTLEKMRKEMDAISFDMSNRKDLTDIERQKLSGYLESLTHQYSLWQSQIDLNEAKAQTEGTQQSLNVAKTATEGTQQGLNVAKTATEGTQQGLNVALTSYWESMPSKVKAEADLLAQKANLTEQQAREVKNLIALRWSQFGVDTAERISRETREWLYGWIPLRRQGEKMTVDMDKIREETKRLKQENEFWGLNH